MTDNKSLTENQVNEVQLSAEEIKQIKLDKLQYQNNKMSANLTYLAILFNALYFANIYSVLQKDAGSYYFNYVIGLSVLYNLVFMLTAFLASQGVRNYHFGHSITLIVIGALQILRIFYIPLKAFSTYIKITIGTEVVQKRVMETGQFSYLIVLLVLASICLIVAGIVGIIKSKRLNNYLNSKNQG